MTGKASYIFWVQGSGESVVGFRLPTSKITWLQVVSGQLQTPGQAGQTPGSLCVTRPQELT